MVSEATTRLILTVLSALLAPVFSLIFKKLVERSPMRARIKSYFIKTGTWVIYFVVVMFILSELGLETSAFAVILLLTGLFFLLVSQEAAKNFMAREVIEMFREIKIGDWIEFRGHYGRVSQIDSLYTMLVSQEGEKIIIPNSLFLEEIIVNRSSKSGVRTSVFIETKKKLDVEEFEKKLKPKIKSLGINDKEPEVLLKKRDDTGTEFEVQLWILNPSNENEVNSKVKKEAKDIIDSL